ncbi:MAG TPA: hemolysin family protein [Gaiellaceae bacterium]|nr:hemolysin family protein [Gaiellaceae bacterium]
MSDALRILVIFALVLGNAIFVAAEYALVTARRTRLQERAERGNRSARIVLEQMDEPISYISTVQIGITAFGIALGAVGEPLLSGYFEWLPPAAAFVLAFAVLTYLSVALGELVPKGIALQVAEPIALALANPMRLLQKLSAPIVWLLNVSASGVMRVLGFKPAVAGEVSHSEDELRRLLAGAEDAGVIENAEEEMLYKVFDFGDMEVSQVMVPRPEVVGISADMPLEEALRAVVDSPFTRYPVYRGSLDEVVGILHVRDLFAAIHDLGLASVSLESIVRPPYVVPETKDLAALLADFRREKQHLAVVVDEYGAMEGIVTLEDLLEEIVGEIEDEFDLPDTSIERIDERRIRIEGTYTIDDFNEEFGTRLAQEDYHTIAGLVFGALGRAPEVGDEVRSDGLRLSVLEVEGSRIMKLEVEFGVESETPSDEPAAA